jgi:hypothetical protein
LERWEGWEVECKLLLKIENLLLRISRSLDFKLKITKIWAEKLQFEGILKGCAEVDGTNQRVY